MKLNELMDGDLVFDKETKQPRKISGTNDLLFHDDYDPIPLTEDILVKNGWRKHILLYENEWYGEIGLFEKHYKFYYMDLKIKYVHQLQHLLRLCGIEKELTI